MSKLRLLNMTTNQTQNKNNSLSLSDLKIALLIIERDIAQDRKERIDKLILEEQAQSSLLTEKPTQTEQSKANLEIRFTILRFETQKGSKIGEYEIAFKQNNLQDKWQAAYNVLNVNNSTIKTRYHAENFEFSYWLYGEGKIYRQKLKEKQ